MLSQFSPLTLALVWVACVFGISRSIDGQDPILGQHVDEIWSRWTTLEGSTHSLSSFEWTWGGSDHEPGSRMLWTNIARWVMNLDLVE